MIRTIFLLFFLVALSPLSYAQNVLSAAEFSNQLKQTPNALLIDVRTPDEFKEGHIQGAKNIDWNEGNFEAQVAKLDKKLPVYIYCLSGGRSSAAAQSMRNLGFKVTELSGGILKWRQANLPITPAEIKVPSQGLTRAQFEKLLESDRLVLVDFYADWCAPCKRIKPSIDQLSEEMADKIVVLRINYDQNKALCAELRIDAIPILQLYKAKKLCWTNEGYIEKAEIANWINKF